MSKRHDDADAPAGPDTSAAVRRARGSVHEAIGKLIGDDAATRRGTAEKQAAGDGDEKPPRP